MTSFSNPIASALNSKATHIYLATLEKHLGTAFDIQINSSKNQCIFTPRDQVYDIGQNSTGSSTLTKKRSGLALP